MLVNQKAQWRAEKESELHVIDLLVIWSGRKISKWDQQREGSSSSLTRKNRMAYSGQGSSREATDTEESS